MARYLVFIAAFVMAFPAALMGQTTSDADKFTATPVCSDLINDTGYAIYGAIETDRADGPDGDILYYRSNFRLKAEERTQICSNGPFFDGGKLLLTLRSLFPLFECKTSLGQPITITAKPKESGGFDWSATCY